MHVLVTGATGFVGRRLVPVLLARGHRVTVLVRDASTYTPPAPAGDDDAERSRDEGGTEPVRVVEGDLLDPETLPPAVEGVEAVYYLVHSMGAGGDFAERDRRAARNVVDAADDAGVERLIYLGGLGEEGDDLSEHLRSRREVERILGTAEADLTTLRAAIIVGDGSASFDVVRQLADRLPVMVTPKWVDTDCQPVAIDDVVACLVGVLDHPETADETYEIGGDTVLTYGEILRRTREHLGGRLHVIRLPVLTPRLSSYWIGLVTDVPVGVARPLIDGLRNPVVAEDDRLFDLLGVRPTGFDEAVARALAEHDDAAARAAENGLAKLRDDGTDPGATAPTRGRE